jgi:hypothetical protein
MGNFMHSGKKLFVLVPVLVLLIFSCSKNTQTNIPQDQAEQESVTEETQTQQTSSTVVDTEYETIQKRFTLPDGTAADNNFNTQAHEKYLTETTTFIPLPAQGIQDGNTAVVGSRECMLYEAGNFSTDNGGTTIKDKNNMKGITVPFSSIVKITGDRLLCNTGNTDVDSKKMFTFQEYRNWFYPAEWQGHTGYIYGADLQGLGKSLNENRISAELYRTGGKFASFYPVAGYSVLSDKIVSSIEADRIAFQQTEPQQFVNPDDMITCYQKLSDKNVPVFITTDLASHSQNLVFNRLLQHLEEYYFEPKLLALTDEFIDALRGNHDADEEVRETAVMYFEVAQAILRTAPERVEDDANFQEPVTYISKNENDVLAGYPEQVVADVHSIMSAYGSTSTIFGSAEDFTNYTPRGHYAKNGILKSYFRASSWYRQLDFPIGQTTATDKTLLMNRTILFIIDTVRKNIKLYNDWAAFFYPLAELTGQSGNLSIDDLLPLWKEQHISNFTQWAAHKENISIFMKLSGERLCSAAAGSNSTWLSPASGEENNSTSGWSMLGRRFAVDTAIHERVSEPQFADRDMVSGLDIIKVSGSRTAEHLLAQEYEQHTELSEKLSIMQQQTDSLPDEYWNATCYNQALLRIRTLAEFEQGVGFYFTETPAWNFKAMLTSHGTWTELHRDVILFTKQYAAEKSDSGSIKTQTRTEPLPDPINYVEPDIPFWEASAAAVKKLQDIYTNYSLPSDAAGTVLTRLMDIYTKAADVCRLEAADEPITAEQNAWIAGIANELGTLVMIHDNAYADFDDDPDLLKMAFITDIYTSEKTQQTLEAGTGIPYRMYVALNDSQGGKRIGIGYCFSYAEFTRPKSDRMTDTQWKKTAYTKDAGLEQYMPFWERACVLPEDSTLQ